MPWKHSGLILGSNPPATTEYLQNAFWNFSTRLSVKSDMSQNPVNSSRWISVSISIGVGLFIFALAVSALLVPQLRLLHVLQALIYVAVLVLTRQNSPWGFGIGVIIPAAWNCLNLFVTHLFQKGAEQFWSLVHTGQFWSLLRIGRVSRLETMVVTFAGLAHLLLIIACMVGFIQLHPRKKQWGQFFAGGFVALVYFALIIAIAAPR